MWSETKRVPIVSSLSRLITDDGSELSTWASNEVKKRNEDDRYWLTVKHVGDKDHAFRYDELVAREDSERVLARARASARLRESGAEITRELLDEYARCDPIWRHALGESCKAWFVEGVVNGEAEYHRIYALGFEDGGASSASSLLIHSAFEVRRFQEVPPETLKSGT